MGLGWRGGGRDCLSGQDCSSGWRTCFWWCYDYQVCVSQLTMEEKILLHRKVKSGEENSPARKVDSGEENILLHRSLTGEENSPAQKVKILLHRRLSLEKNILLHRKTTLEKQILPPLLLGIEPVTFWPWLALYHWALVLKYMSACPWGLVWWFDRQMWYAWINNEMSASIPHWFLGTRVHDVKCKMHPQWIDVNCF